MIRQSLFTTERSRTLAAVVHEGRQLPRLLNARDLHKPPGTDDPNALLAAGVG